MLQHFGLYITDTPSGWMLLGRLLMLSLPSYQPLCFPTRLPPLRGKIQGPLTPCCISYLHTYTLVHFLIRKVEKQSAAKKQTSITGGLHRLVRALGKLSEVDCA